MHKCGSTLGIDYIYAVISACFASVRKFRTQIGYSSAKSTSYKGKSLNKVNHCGSLLELMNIHIIMHWEYLNIGAIDVSIRLALNEISVLHVFK